MITIYTTPHCVPCKSAKQFFDTHDIEYETVDVTTKPDIHQNLIDLLIKPQWPVMTDGTNYVNGLNYAEMRKLNA